jgi:hypothetical protein
LRSLVSLLALLALLPAAGGAALFPRQRLEAEYRHVLTRWATGDEDGALAALERLAAGATGDRSSVRLERARRDVARGLGRREAAAVPAVVWFETRAYHHLVTARRPELAVRSRLLASELAERYAQRGGAASREVAAGLLASLAGHLHLAAQEASAVDLYQRALAIEGRQPAALLGLAALREKRGDYASAVALLDRVKPVPGGREGRLRRAVNLLRVGRDGEGEAELRSLAGDGADWIRAVAAQELGRALGARGEVTAAAVLLANAAAASPCDPSLAVQTALFAERSGADTPIDLAGLAECAEAAVSPRARYTRPPASELRVLRGRLGELEPAWREALRRALER